MLAAIVYVDGLFSSFLPGDPIADADSEQPGNQPAIFGVDAFATIQDGVNNADTSGEVFISPGVYAESVIVSFPLRLSGTSHTPGSITISPPTATPLNGINLISGADDVLIERVTITGAAGDGIRAVGVANTSLDEVTSSLNAGHGFYGEGLAGTLSMTGGGLLDNTLAGLEVVNSVSLDVSLIAIDVRGNEYGVGVSSSASLSVLGGHFSENNNDGFRVSDLSGSVSIVDTFIQDNDFDLDGFGNGIEMSDGPDPDNLALGGAILLQGVTISDTDAAGLLRNQVSGVVSHPIAGGLFVSESALYPWGITDHESDNLVLLGAGSVDISAGSLSGSRTGRGILLSNITEFVGITNTLFINNAGAGLEITDSLSVATTNLELSGNGAGGAILTDVNSFDATTTTAAVAEQIDVSDSRLGLVRNSLAQDDFQFTNVANIAVRADDGDDNVTVTPSLTSSFFLDGGDPVATFGDRLTVNVSGSVLDDGSTIAAPPFQLIQYQGFEEKLFRSQNNTPLITGSGEDDLLEVFATSSNSGTYRLTIDVDGSAGGPLVSPIVSFSNIESFEFAARGGIDRMVVNNPAGDVFLPAPTSISTNLGGTTVDAEELELIGGAANDVEHRIGLVSGIQDPLWINSQVAYRTDGSSLSSSLTDRTSTENRLIQIVDEANVAGPQKAFSINDNAIPGDGLSEIQISNAFKTLPLRTVTFANPSNLLSITDMQGASKVAPLQILGLDDRAIGDWILSYNGDVVIGDSNANSAISLETSGFEVHSLTVDIKSDIDSPGFVYVVSQRGVTIGADVSIRAASGILLNSESDIAMLSNSLLSAPQSHVSLRSTDGVVTISQIESGDSNIFGKWIVDDGQSGTGIHAGELEMFATESVGQISSPVTGSVETLFGKAGSGGFRYKNEGDLNVRRGSITDTIDGITSKGVVVLQTTASSNGAGPGNLTITGAIQSGSTDAAAVKLLVSDDPSLSQIQTVNAIGEIISGGGIQISGAEEVHFAPGSLVSTSKTPEGVLSINAGSPTASATINLEGTLTASTLNVVTHDQDDSVRIVSSNSVSADQIHLNAGQGNDTYKIDLARVNVGVLGPGLSSSSIFIDDPAGMDHLQLSGNDAEETWEISNAAQTGYAGFVSRTTAGTGPVPVGNILQYSSGIDSLQVDAAAGKDTVYLEPSGTANLNVIGGDPTTADGDRLVLTVPNLPAVQLGPEGFSVPGFLSPIKFSEFEDVGTIGVSRVNMTGDGGNDTFTLYPQPDGSVIVDGAIQRSDGDGGFTTETSSLSITIGQGQSASIIGAGGDDSVEVIGRDSATSFSISEGGLRIGEIPIDLDEIGSLRVNTGNSSNTITLGVANDLPSELVLIGDPNRNSQLNLDLAGVQENIRIGLHEVDGGEFGFSGMGQSIIGLGIADTTAQFFGFARLNLLGDSDDNVTIVADMPSNLQGHNGLRIASAGQGKDSLTGNGATDVSWSGLGELIIESPTGLGKIDFVLDGLDGSNFYTANLFSSDVVNWQGSDGLDDNLLIGRYGNAWHPIGAEIRGAGPKVRIAGGARLNIFGGQGDDTVVIDVDQARGSDIIGIPIRFDGGDGGFDVLEFVGDSTTPVETLRYVPGPDAHNGKVGFEDVAGQRLMDVEFTGLEPVRSSMQYSWAHVEGSNASERISFSVFKRKPLFSSFNRPWGRVRIDNKEVFEFQLRNGTDKLYVDGNGGNDEFQVQLEHSSLIDTIFSADTHSDSSIKFTAFGSNAIHRFDLDASGNSVSLSNASQRIQVVGIHDVSITGDSQLAGQVSVLGSVESDQLTFQMEAPNPNGSGSPEIQFRLSNTLRDTDFKLTNYSDVDFNLGGGLDSVWVQGTEFDDQGIELRDDQIRLPGGHIFDVLAHESVIVETGLGNDAVFVNGNINQKIHVDAGQDGDDFLFFQEQAISLTMTPDENRHSGRLQAVNAIGGRTDISFSGVDELETNFSGAPVDVDIFADGAANEITIDGDLKTDIQIDDRTPLTLSYFGEGSLLNVFGLEGSDRFSVSPGVLDIKIDGGQSDAPDSVWVYSDEAIYLPPNSITASTQFLNGRSTLAVDHFDHITLEANRVNALSAIGPPSRSFRLLGPTAPQAKTYAFVSTTTGTDIPIVSLIDPTDHSVSAESNTESGVLIASGLAGESSMRLLDIRSVSGEAIEDVELFAAAVDRDDFQGEVEPNNEPAQAPVLDFDVNRRLARRGNVVGIDTDLIAVQIDHNHRIAAIVDNDPAGVGQRIHSVVEVLGPDGVSVVASSLDNGGPSVDQQGNGLITDPLAAGTYFIRISNTNPVGDGAYEIVIMDVDPNTAVTHGLAPIDFERRAAMVPSQEYQAESEPNNQPTDLIAVQIDHNHRLARNGSVTFGDNDLIAVQIDHNHRIAAVVDHDPLSIGTRTPARLEILGPDGVTVLAKGADIDDLPVNSAVTGKLAAGVYYVRVSNQSPDSPVDYGLVVYDIGNEQTYRDPSDGDGMSYRRDLLPGQHVQAAIPKRDSLDDSVELIPIRRGESTVTFNDSTPLNLMGVSEFNIDAVTGIDQLKVVGTVDADAFALQAGTLTVSGENFGIGGFESHLLLGRLGSDVLVVAPTLNATGGVRFDGGQGDDQIYRIAKTQNVDVQLPGSIVDGIELDYVGVEDVFINAATNASDVAIRGSSRPDGSVDVSPLSSDTVVVDDGSVRLTVETTADVLISGLNPSGPTSVIRTARIHGTDGDDQISVTNAAVDFAGTVKRIRLDHVPVVEVNALRGFDDIAVVPSASTRFFIDGGGPAGFGDSLELLTSATSTLYSGPQNDEGVFVTASALPVSFDHIEEARIGPALVDLLVDIDGTSGISLPSTIEAIGVRQLGSNLQILDRDNGTIEYSVPVHTVGSLKIIGSSIRKTNVVIDFQDGDAMQMPGGMHVDAGSFAGNKLSVIGDNQTFVEHRTIVSPAGPPKITLRKGNATLDVRYENYKVLDFSTIGTFDAIGLFDVGGKDFSIDATGPVQLGSMTRIHDGSLSSTSTLVIENNESIIGYGVIDGAVAGAFGSLIRATGNLTIGSSTSPIGFATSGELYVDDNQVDLKDANQAFLGSLTSLGLNGVDGTLVSANGLYITTGSNIAGHGTITTPNDVSQPIVNNGSIAGSDAIKSIDLQGYVKGVGTIENVVISGTHSPGLSPAIVQAGNLVMAPQSRSIMEIGGLSPGASLIPEVSGYDRIESSGSITLAGSLEVLLIDDFVPQVGDNFLLLKTAEGLVDSPSDISTPALPPGMQWRISQSSHELSAEVVYGLPNVMSVEIGDGSDDRSNVTSVRVSVNGAVRAEAGAFTVIRRGSTTPLATEVSTDTSGVNTIFNLSFSGPLTRGGQNALIDGNYQLIIDASKVTIVGTDVQLDGDHDGVAGGNFAFGESEVDRFFAFYGDTDGDRDVDGRDVSRFGMTFRKTSADDAFNPSLDFLGDGDVDGSDVYAFGQRFRQRLAFE